MTSTKPKEIGSFVRKQLGEYIGTVGFDSGSTFQKDIINMMYLMRPTLAGQGGCSSLIAEHWIFWKVSRLVPVLCNQTEPNVSVQVLNRPTDLSSDIPSYTDLLKLTCPELEELFTGYLEKMQYDCKKILRYGNTGDGGWDICEDPYYIPSKNSIVYSFGIANDFSFDDAISKRRHVRVHSFDPTNNMSDHQRSDLITFHALGIADYTGTTPKGWKVARLTDIKTRLGHNQGTVEIVKIDIEEAEWLILPEIIFSESLKGTKQLLMEWHIYPDKKRKKTIITHALQILRHLYRMGFRLFKLHYNPLCNEHPKSDYRYCPEMYFVNINKNM